MGSFLFGYDFGATSWLLVDISYLAEQTTDDFASGVNFYKLIDESAGMTGLIAAGASIGALLTYLPLLFFGNHILKKDEIMLAAFLYFCGALLESTSGAAGVGWTDGDFAGLAVLLTGRLVYGAGIASSFHAVPAYVSELGPAPLRGMVGSITEAMIVTGVVVGFVVGYFYENGGGWVVPFRVGYVIALLMGLLALFIPHAPSGMVRAEYSPEDVLEAVRYIHPEASATDVQELFACHEEEKMDRVRWEKLFRTIDARAAGHSISNSSSNSSSSSSSAAAAAGDGGDSSADALWGEPSMEVQVLFRDSIQARCLALAVLLVVLQIGTGQGVIVYYAGDIFEELCPNSYDECLLGFGAVKLLSSYLMVGVADCMGRRDFLVYGTAVMVFGMLLLTIGYSNGALDTALAGLYVSTAGYEFGLGSFMWVMLSEIFPRFTRGAANSVAVSTLFLFSTLMTFTLPYLYADFGLLPIFVLFTCVSGVSVAALYLYAPETSGVELEEAYKLVDVRCRAAACCPFQSGAGDLDDELIEGSKQLLKNSGDLNI